MKKYKSDCVGFYPGNFRVYIEWETRTGRHTGIHHNPYYTEKEAQRAIKEALEQPDIDIAYYSQELIPLFAR